MGNCVQWVQIGDVNLVDLWWVGGDPWWVVTLGGLVVFKLMFEIGWFKLLVTFGVLW